jgi:ubiquitin-protein ligase E3 A
MELEMNTMDCRNPIIPFDDFYNEPLSDVGKMDRDLTHFANASESASASSSQTPKISFMYFFFIMTPASKALGLYYDNRTCMYIVNADRVYLIA